MGENQLFQNFRNRAWQPLYCLFVKVHKRQGQNAVIMPGVHIGDGAIIGANAIVASNIAPYTINVGNPCRTIKKRFDDKMIELLEKFCWWDKSIEEINKLIPILTSSDLEMVRRELKKR